MNRQEYNDGYEAAIEAIKQALQNASNGQQGGNSSSQQQGMNQPQQGMNTSINPQNNQGKLSQQAQQAMSGQQGPGSGAGAGGQMQVQSPAGSSESGAGAGSGDGIPGGSSNTGSAQQAKKSEVSELGGGFIDKELGKKIAQEAGYDNDEIGNDEDVQAKWRKIGEQVAQQAKGQGIGSGRGGRLQNLLDNIYKPAKDWKSELKRFAGHAISRDTETAWGRKARLQYDEIARYDHPMHNSLSRVVFMIDTSGSNIDMLDIILSQAFHIVKSKHVESVTFVYYDYGVCDFETLKDVKNFKPNKLKNTSGGGGTSFKKACTDFAEILKKNPGRKHVDLLMIFTDGDTCEEVKERPKWCKNAMFVITDRPSCNEMAWGKTLWVNKEDVK